MTPSAPKRLAVFLPNPLGDAVMATPALRALHERLPETEILWLGRRAAHEALAGLPWRTGVVPLQDGRGRGARSPWRARKVLRALGADAALLLPNSFRSALAARLARIPRRIGTRLHRRGVLLTDVVEVPLTETGPARLAPRSMTRHYADLVAHLVGAFEPGAPEVRFSAFDDERATRRLEALPGEAPWVGVSPGAAFGATKVLPPDRLAAALDALATRTPVRIVLLGGPGEGPLLAATADAMKTPVLSTQDAPPDLGELKALLARCRVVLASDAGPRHLAEALGVPTVVWMGPTDPRWSEPSPAVLLRDTTLDCLGCHKTTCPIGLLCMQNLDPDALAEAAEGLLAS